MTKFRLKVWTGPTLAKDLGRWIRRVGLPVVTGTEHVYVTVKGSTCAAAEHNMRAALFQKYRTDWQLRASECRKVGGR